MAHTTVLLQGITAFKGRGLYTPEPLDLTCEVPQGCSGVQHVRAGNASDGMANITLLKNGKTMRHVPLAIVDELRTGTAVEIVAGEGMGTPIVDVGKTEVPTGVRRLQVACFAGSQVLGSGSRNPVAPTIPEACNL